MESRRKSGGGRDERRPPPILPPSLPERVKACSTMIADRNKQRRQRQLVYNNNNNNDMSNNGVGKSGGRNGGVKNRPVIGLRRIRLYFLRGCALAGLAVLFGRQLAFNLRLRSTIDDLSEEVSLSGDHHLWGRSGENSADKNASNSNGKWNSGSAPAGEEESPISFFSVLSLPSLTRRRLESWGILAPPNMPQKDWKKWKEEQKKRRRRLRRKKQEQQQKQHSVGVREEDACSKKTRSSFSYFSLSSLTRKRLRPWGARATSGSEEIDLELAEAPFESRTAVVVTLPYVTECEAARLRHLVATANVDSNSSSKVDVWVLHSHEFMLGDDQVEMSECLINSIKGLRSAPQPSEYGPLSNFDSEASATSKSSFLRFLKKYWQYKYAWHLESDVFYTGRWYEVFEPIEQLTRQGERQGGSDGREDEQQQEQMRQKTDDWRAMITNTNNGNHPLVLQSPPPLPAAVVTDATDDTNTSDASNYEDDVDDSAGTTVSTPPLPAIIDFVYTKAYVHHGPRWWNTGGGKSSKKRCHVHGRDCRWTMPYQVYWMAVRMSRRMAISLLDDLESGINAVGHHEAVVATYCAVMNYTMVPLPKSRVSPKFQAGNTAPKHLREEERRSSNLFNAATGVRLFGVNSTSDDNENATVTATLPFNVSTEVRQLRSNSTSDDNENASAAYSTAAPTAAPSGMSASSTAAPTAIAASDPSIGAPTGIAALPTAAPTGTTTSAAANLTGTANSANATAGTADSSTATPGGVITSLGIERSKLYHPVKCVAYGNDSVQMQAEIDQWASGNANDESQETATAARSEHI